MNEYKSPEGEKETLLYLIQSKTVRSTFGNCSLVRSCLVCPLQTLHPSCCRTQQAQQENAIARWIEKGYDTSELMEVLI
jgi:hypothetical protein